MTEVEKIISGITNIKDYDISNDFECDEIEALRKEGIITDEETFVAMMKKLNNISDSISADFRQLNMIATRGKMLLEFLQKSLEARDEEDIKEADRLKMLVEILLKTYDFDRDKVEAFLKDGIITDEETVAKMIEILRKTEF